MTVTLDPPQFRLVDYDPGRIRELVEQVRDDVGLAAERSIRVEMDESTPLLRIGVASIDPIVLEVQSGAFEEPKKPRAMSEAATTDVLGRLLYRVRDRLDPDFGDPPDEVELTQEQRTAWDVHSVARLGRAGYPTQRQRRLYAFRTRHSFSDVADDAFERLWNAEQLTWSDIESLSAEALAAD